MSYYTGYEIVIASDNESTLQQVLKDLREYFHEFDNDEGLKKLGDNYIVKVNEATTYEFDYVTDFITELVDKYGCKIEVFAESREVAYFWHFYYDGKMEEPIYESNELNLFTHEEDDDLDFFLSAKPFLSDVSAQAAKVLSVKYDLCEKWCGFYPLTLGDCEYWHYIGRGYANTKKYIDLSEYEKKLNPEDENSVENNEANKGKVIRSLDSYGEETIDEYDDNGILIHHKDNYEESWWNGKRQLVHIKQWGWEVFYEYDDEGRLIREFYPEGYEITYEYNPEGLLIEEKDNEGHRIIYSYVNGKQASKTCFNPYGQIVYKKTQYDEYWTGYDDKGQVIYEVFEDGGEQRRYNSKGNEVFNLSYSSHYFTFYDSKDRVIYIADSNHHNRGCVYDDKGQLRYDIMNGSFKSIEDYEGHYLNEKEQDFDPSSICDRDGNPLYSYDKTKKEHKWFDDGNTYICRKLSEDEWDNIYELDYIYEWLEYDAKNNLVRKIIFSIENKRGINYYYHEYDSRDNLIHAIYPSGDQEWCEYDENGNLIHRRDLLERFEI